MDNNNFKKLHGIMIIRKFLNVYPKCNKGMLRARDSKHCDHAAVIRRV